jgi:hypothetical protein
MLPKAHIISGLIFSILVFLLFPKIGVLNVLIIFLASFLIDVDHYLYYVYKTGRWNLKSSFFWYTKNKALFHRMTRGQKKKIYTGLCFLHGIEALVLCLALYSFLISFSEIFLYILIGFIFHQILDAIALYRIDYRFDKVISFVYAIYNSKNKKLLQEIKRWKNR